MEFLVRDARLTDIDRINGLMERADAQWSLDRLNGAADVLRQVVYLPNAAGPHMRLPLVRSAVAAR